MLTTSLTFTSLSNRSRYHRPKRLTDFLASILQEDDYKRTSAPRKESGIPYGEEPGRSENMRGPGMTQGARGMGKAVYFRDPTGHMLEIKTYDSV